MSRAAFAVVATLLLARQGPTSSQSPYLVPIAPNLYIQSLLTVGDSVNAKPDGSPYRLVGIPDGMGAFDNHNGTFTLLVNHELHGISGFVRAHGARGAFVSRWIVDQSTLAVLHGSDLIERVATWNPQTRDYEPPRTGVLLHRFCSGDLANFDGELLYLNGEELHPDGRAFAHQLDGTSWELPRLGRAAWENAVAHPAPGAKTIVVLLDDSNLGQVYVYVGEKQSGGSLVERAGLTNGRLYGVKVAGVPFESVENGIPSGTSFTLHDLGDVENMPGAVMEHESVVAGITGWLRPEDGAWDPSSPNDFLFVTTATFDTRSRLWRLRFDDLADPGRGGRVEMLLDGTEGPKMMDNMTVTRRGEVFVQEDPDAGGYLAKIWRYVPSTRQLDLVAEHDPLRFAAGIPGTLTLDEESSGIIDASHILGDGWLLLNVQAHHVLGGELVEGGQLLAMRWRPLVLWRRR